eukprot:CAMPEP_0170192838 /NCGR_PEP_ID=MMETSP0040_2-20121228/55347_1 /TAXON_ID=641309 /ORGANISM="Lotharella oceanica, Strain CCMP622" /LENGTH=180 /DNA_ID=CAMNT_0010441303 /DNA_START=830 /DNA_END=1372 /DNA_ORIENTATION=-
MGETYPSQAHFYWVVSHKDVQAYRWFVARLKEVQDCVVNMRKKNSETMSSKFFRFHIYVTSVKESKETKEGSHQSDADFWGVPSKESDIVTERAHFSKMDLYNALLYPKRDHHVLGDIHIWKGRPNWDDRFQEVSESNPKGPVGVMFCGNRHIGADLKDKCVKFSSVAQGRMFKLHKENF